MSTSIGLLSAGGFANKPAHDTFCAKLDCVISNVFDQSPQHNHLGQRHKLINASRHSVTVGMDKTPVYGMWCMLLRGCCCPSRGNADTALRCAATGSTKGSATTSTRPKASQPGMILSPSTPSCQARTSTVAV